MTELTLDAGLKSFNINGKCEVSFNPTDIYFMQRLYAVLVELEETKDQREKELASVNSLQDKADAQKFFDLSRRYDEEMREKLDKAVGGPISKAVAGDINIYAMSNNDVPIYVDIIFALIDQMDAGITAAAKNMTPKVEKYLSKYQNKYHR